MLHYIVKTLLCRHQASHDSWSSSVSDYKSEFQGEPRSVYDSVIPRPKSTTHKLRPRKHDESHHDKLPSPRLR